MEIWRKLITMKHIVLGLLAGLVLSSCALKVEKPTPSLPDEKIPFRIDVAENRTKVSAAGYDINDEVGIYIVNYQSDGPADLVSDGNHLTNQRFVKKAEGWTAEKEIYWKDATTHADIYCYYPYVTTVADVENLSFSVKTDQSGIENYFASQFHWSKTSDLAPTEDAVKILNNQLMSKLEITLTPGKGFVKEDLADAVVKVVSTRPAASINLKDGSVVPSGDTADILTCKTDTRYQAIIVPQEISEATVIVVTVAGTEYKLRQSIVFESGKSYSAAVTVSKTTQGIDVGIGDWIEGGNFGGVAE